MVGRARGRLEGWILRTGGDLIYMLIDDGGRCTACRATLSPRRNNPRNMVYK